MEQPALKNATFPTLTESHRKQWRSQNWSQMIDIYVNYDLKLVSASDGVAVASYDDFRAVYFA